jgi:Rieske Fe-S protein
LNEPITRRSLLEAGAAGLVAAFALPFASGCGPADEACAPGSCTVNASTLVLSLADHPELVPVLGWSVYRDPRYDDPVCHGDQILVIQVSQGNYVALSASCTHACCTVGVETGGDTTGIFCPCHGSSYSLEGVAASGPALATGSLPTLPVSFDGSSVYVQLG